MVKVGKDFKLRVQKTAARRGVLRSRAERGVVPVQFEFPIALDQRLERVAGEMGLKKTDIVKHATASALDALEGVPAK
jgi:hypothetical protein